MAWALVCLFASCGLSIDGASGEGQPRKETTAHSATGTIEGIVTYHGAVPKSDVADQVGQRRELLQVNDENHGLQDVVVYLADQTARGSLAEHSEESKGPAGASEVVVDQKGYTFIPRVMAVRAGQPVKFTNSDPSVHNVRTVALKPENQFNVQTTWGGSYVHRFRADPQYRPIRIGCDIHSWMRAWIYVFDHPYYAVTNSRGRFRITGVPSGKYRLLTCQPDGGLKAEREVIVEIHPPARVKIEFHETDLTLLSQRDGSEVP